MTRTWKIFCLALMAAAVTPWATAQSETAGPAKAMPPAGHVGNCASCHGRRAENRYRFDSHTGAISISLDNHGFGAISGRFDDFEGGFVFDLETPETGSVVVTIQTASLDLGDALMNLVAKSWLFLNVSRHPLITFNAKRAERTGDKAGRITGDLTLAGITKPLTFDVSFNKAGPHPVDGLQSAGFSAVGTLRRSDFGLGFGLPGVGDVITLRIEVVGKRID